MGKRRMQDLNTNQHGLVSSALLIVMLAFSQAVSADWQVSSPDASAPREPFFQAGTQRQAAFSTAYRSEMYPSEYSNLGRTAPIYAVSISGSLKDNIERIMRRYHWRVVWKAPYDYNFDGRVTGSSLPNVLQKVLQPFPLQAVMYMSNRTVAILPRQTR
jgi:hypothetical protein